MNRQQRRAMKKNSVEIKKDPVKKSEPFDISLTDEGAEKIVDDIMTLLIRMYDQGELEMSPNRDLLIQMIMAMGRV